MYSVNDEVSEGASFQQYRLSWCAHLEGMWVILLLAAIAAFIGMWSVSLEVILFILLLGICISNWLHVRSVKLYTNDEGVWVYSGYLPWNKGTTGMKWRDMEDAVFYQGFFSWAFNSYGIRIKNRFTRKSELSLTNVLDGQNAVIHINEILKNKIRSLPQ